MNWQLQPLNDVDFTRQRVTYGYTDALSLTGAFAHTIAEMRADPFADGELTQSSKTALHETVHLYQTLTTSYGYYCQLLRDFQVNAILLIVEALRDDLGLPLRLPLSAQVQALPDNASGNRVRGLLRLWSLAELFLNLFEADADAFDRRVRARAGLGPLFDRPLIASFAELDWWLGAFVGETGRAHLPDRDADDLAWADHAGEDEHLVFAWKYFGDRDTAAVLESAATAAELWESRRPVPPDAAVGGVAHHLVRYWAPLRQAAARLQVKDQHGLAVTFGIMADVALNGPLLPHHHADRAPGLPFRDLDPWARLRQAIEVCSRLEPVHELSGSEYVRFAVDLSDACGWVTPLQLQMSARALMPPDPRQDVATSRFQAALETRSYAPHAFSELGIWYQEGSELADYIVYTFSHPVQIYSDGVRLHNDQEYVGRAVDAAMVRSYLRRALLTRDPVVTLPYPADAEELEIWRSRLRATLTDVGFRNPRITVRPAPQHFEHLKAG